jgi:hypothetical protein
MYYVRQIICICQIEKQTLQTKCYSVQMQMIFTIYWYDMTNIVNTVFHWYVNNWLSIPVTVLSLALS